MAEPPTENGIRIRSLTEPDLAAGLRLCRACQWNQVEDDWRYFVGGNGAGWLAERGGDVVGTVARLRYARAFSWIAMMLVDPCARLGGIGSRLFESALADLRDEPCIRLDATPAGEPLYRRYGFASEYPLVRTKTVVDAKRFHPFHDKARPMIPTDLPEIFARDEAVFGADRSALLASLFHRSPEMAWVARAGDGLTGYCFGRWGYLYGQLGPIVAEDAAIAGELAGHSLSTQDGKQIAVDIPRHASEWIQWMESAGFEVERPFLRMCLGTNPSPGLPDRVFGIAGPEFG